MSFTLEKVVPWGRSYGEYISMFSLSETDLERRILGCGDGPAAFNAELTRKGGVVVSVDPIYRFTPEQIEVRIAETYKTVLEQTEKNKDEFVWRHIRSVEELGKIRMEAMHLFLMDFQGGKWRYVAGELPSLDFHDNEFGLALCSHLLFLYSGQLSAKFHIQSIKELCRVADEVRIFPLLELGAKKSRHLEAVVEYLSDDGYECTVEKVEYEFQKGGDKMLRVKCA